jgi:D-alanyl-D-alanine carboxypeptidase
MSARDLAIFFAALFERRVFDRPETLAEMLRRGPHQRADHYRLGVFVISTADGRDIYWHSGFWGTIVAYDPQAKMAVSGMTTNQDNFLATARVVQHILDTPPRVP